MGIVDAVQLEALFAALREEFDRAAAEARDGTEWEALRVAWAGRKAGKLRQITENWLKPAPPELKRAVGQHLNELRAHLEATLAKPPQAGAAAVAAAEAERVDLSLPGIERYLGVRHILSQVLDEIQQIFLRIGFTVVDGPEIETPYYNFEALNMPADHPARDMWDTLYVETPRPGELLLRTHTSPMQIRWMEEHQPPVRIIVPGKVYRHDNPDATHAFAFYQVEGLAVDTDITFCDFRGVMDYFVKEFFGPKVKTRLQPSYFPFTEPSADVYGSCFVCEGAGCRLCKQSGWIELCGAGMVDPAVYGFVGYDAKKFSGFAFGMGVERMAMLKYGINDIQLFFQNDVRFLRQFR
ncbi:MAG: phenylalanine--tRNA ligase subunit alpha [Firmicutes bacterium]|nr:phenylalanine--tRNA ligase subunit alpha [Bacillota bacterium]